MNNLRRLPVIHKKVGPISKKKMGGLGVGEMAG
jgi:hypothetical protein